LEKLSLIFIAKFDIPAFVGKFAPAARLKDDIITQI
jgi:hypothetical protein